MLALKIVEHKTKRCSSQLSNLPVEQLLRSSSSVEENLSLWTRVVENLLSLYEPDFGRRVFLSMDQDRREFLSMDPSLVIENFSLWTRVEEYFTLWTTDLVVENFSLWTRVVENFSLWTQVRSKSTSLYGPGL